MSLRIWAVLWLVGPPTLFQRRRVRNKGDEELKSLRDRNRRLVEALQDCRELLARAEALLEQARRAGGPRLDDNHSPAARSDGQPKR